MGTSSSASGFRSTALGLGSTTSGNDSTAVGQGSSAGFDNSAAIGAGAVTTRTNQQVFGNAANTYTAPGISSAASSAAQTGSVGVVTSDAAGNLASRSILDFGLVTEDLFDSLADRVGDNTGRIEHLENRVDRNTARIRDVQNQVDDNTEGIAMTAALTGVPAIVPHGKSGIVAINYGTYGGENGVAAGGAVRLVNDFYGKAGIAVGLGRGNVGGRAGFAWAW